jgi:hypothetical protein
MDGRFVGGGGWVGRWRERRSIIRERSCFCPCSGDATDGIGDFACPVVRSSWGQVPCRLRLSPTTDQFLPSAKPPLVPPSPLLPYFPAHPSTPDASKISPIYYPLTFRFPFTLPSSPPSWKPYACTPSFFTPHNQPVHFTYPPPPPGGTKR